MPESHANGRVIGLLEGRLRTYRDLLGASVRSHLSALL